MWTGVEKLSQQVTQYGTVFGQLWYLTVFVFRLMVVATIGQNVYTDEQSAFRCSTKVLGCDNVCFDRFSKISHIRYWAFQMLAVTAPTVLFHFYSSRIKGRIAKIEKAEEGPEENEKETKRLIRRRKSVGDVKMKTVLNASGTNLEQLATTRKIQIAYYVTVICRAAAEAVSLVLTYQLFHFADYTVEPSNNPLAAILIRVPQVYRCAGENVKWACGQHMSLGNDIVGYVPCWVSRPWEKTIFMCYMNFLSLFCFVISVIEFFQLSGRVCVNRYSTIRRKKNATLNPLRDSPFPSNKEDVG